MTDFEQIYSKYYDVVYQYVRSLCREDVWAEEITQEAFFKALKNIEGFRGECKLSVWLCQIAKNTFYTEAKKRQREDGELPLDTMAAQDGPEDLVIRQEAVQDIHRVLHTLREPYKEVFWMRTFGQLPFQEIGAIFGKTESWARVTYHRAKIKIKEGIQ